MRYQIDLTPDAAADLTALPLEVRRYVLVQMDNLCEDATALSTPSRLPFEPNCQTFLFDKDFGGERWYICVLFRYSQDEQRLEVIRVGRIGGAPDGA